MNTLSSIFVTFYSVILAHYVVSTENSVDFQRVSVNPIFDSTSPDIKTSLLAGNEVISPYLGMILGGFERGEISRYELFANVSSQCAEQTSAWMDALQIALLDISFSNSTWALKMADAWGKIPEGMFSGHTSALGDFDECLAVRSEFDSVAGQAVDNFKGMYCTATLMPNIPTDGGNTNETALQYLQQLLADSSTWENSRSIPPITSVTLLLLISKLGACYPSSCSNEDVAQQLKNTFSKIPIVGELIMPSVAYCTTDDSPKLTNGDIVMLVIISVIVAVCVLGTAIDLGLNPMSSKRNGYFIQALMAFSIYTNTRKWLNTKSSGGDNFGCIHGIRFLSSCWVVLAHQWAMTLVNTWNMADVIQIYKSNFTIYTIINATVSVDTFFTMSGLLFAYNMLKVLNKSKGNINVPMMYLHRYLRLTPTYALLLGLIATFYAYLANGPNWLSIQNSAASCRRNWWHNLLYINNFMKYDATDASNAMCHGETWYLANDMQFFLVSPILIYPLFKWEIFGIIILSLATVASIATPWIIYATYDGILIPTTLPTRLFETGEFMTVSYIKPWMRFGPYAVGLWTGYILYKTANKMVKLPKLAVLAGWMVSTAVALAILFGIIPWFNPENEIPKGMGAFYAATHRLGWGVSIGWIIFACTKGYGGPVNSFLCWKPFIPLGRLTFCVYLISYSLQQMFASSRLQATTYEIYGNVHLYLSHLVVSLIVSFICCITMESPFIALEKLAFQGPTKISKPKPAEVVDAIETEKEEV